MNQRRLVPLTAGALAVALLAGCASPSQPVASSYPTSTYPTSSSYPPAGSYPAPAPAAQAPAAMEYGRVTNIEYVPAGASTAGRSPNILGAVVGGVAGAVLGRQIGGGSGRDAATVLGGVGGAAVGSQVGRGSPQATTTTAASYRIAVQTDQGVTRTYEVSATGDLRVGDRVRVENGVIYRA